MCAVKFARSNADALGSARALACSFRRPRRNIPLSELLKVRDGGAPSPAREARALPGFNVQSAGTVRWIAQSLARCQLFAALPPKMPTRSENAFHLFLNSREQRHRFADDMPIRKAAPLRILEAKPFFLSSQLHLPIQLIENSMRRFRQHR